MIYSFGNVLFLVCVSDFRDGDEAGAPEDGAPFSSPVSP